MSAGAPIDAAETGASGAGAAHATVVVVGTGAVLIRGPSGTGKSSLGLDLIAMAAQAGRFALLVADDRVLLETRHGRLIARTPIPIVGLIEARGRGILTLPCELAAVVRHVIDFTPDGPERMPQDADRSATVLGIRLPRLALRPHDPRAAMTALHFVDARLLESL